MQLDHEPVIVRTVGAIPTWVQWRGTTYSVTDTPTALYGYIAEAPTHPLQPRVGWRFQGTSPAGETHVFDVRQTKPERWDLVAIYD